MFIRRKFFVDIGGFPDRSILEDIAISEKIIGMTEPLLLNMTVITDSRKFISQGIWRSLWRVIMIQICVELRRPLPDEAKMFFRDIR